HGDLLLDAVQFSGWFGSMSSERRNDARAARSSPRQSCAVPREAKARASFGASSVARAKSFSAAAQSFRLSASLPRSSSERLRFHFAESFFGSTRRAFSNAAMASSPRPWSRRMTPSLLYEPA